MFGRIMPAPLLMPVTATVLPPIERRGRGRLRHGVGGHDRLGRDGPVIRPPIGQRRRQRGLDAIVRQRLHDHAGGERQHLLGRAAEQRRQRGAGGTGASEPVGTGACVGVTRVDEDGAYARTCGKMLAAKLHGRSAEAVVGEDARNRRALGQGHDGEVASVRLADAGHGGAAVSFARLGGRVPSARPHRRRPLVHGAVPGLRRRQPRLSTRRLLSGQLERHRAVCVPAPRSAGGPGER